MTKADVKKVVFCTGKFYYDLLEEKEKLNNTDIALVRIEQLFPLHKDKIQAIIDTYPSDVEFVWAQEEPENMGPWKYMRRHFKPIVDIIPVARLASGSPATGLKELHKSGQEEILQKVFRKCVCNKDLKYCSLECVDGKSRQEVLQQHYYFQSDAKFSI